MKRRLLVYVVTLLGRKQSQAQKPVVQIDSV